MADQAVAKKTASPQAPKMTSTYVHIAIGMALMLLFPMIPPADPITPIGMKIVGIFIGMIYLWSTVSSTWPSFLGLLLIGLSGIAGEGYAGVKTVARDAYGQDTVILVLFGMVLFGAVEYVGATKYVARWFVTRKIVNGRPYIFMLMFFLACYVLSAVTSPVISMLIVWGIGKDILISLGVEQKDQIWPVFNLGTFFASTIGQPMLPFKGAQLVVLSAYSKMSGETMAFGPWILYNFIMSMLLLAAFFLMIKFIFRVDVEKLRNINIEHFAKDPLPKINVSQIIILLMLVVYIVMILAPGFLPKSIPGVAFLAKLGVIGVTIVCITVVSIIHINGKPLLPFGPVAAKQMNWGVYFLVAAAVYAADALSKDETGVKPWLIQTLSPVLGDRSPLVFAAIMFTVALIITNFANNAAMAVVLMPVILAFTEQMGISGVPFVAGVGMLVFVSMLTPSASPHAGMMHGRKDLISTGEIMKYGFPACIVSLIIYIVVGYPLATILFA